MNKKEQRQLQDLANGRVKFVPVLVVTIAQDARGQTLISSGPGNVPLPLSAILDLCMQAVAQLWANYRKASESPLIRPDGSPMPTRPGPVPIEDQEACIKCGHGVHGPACSVDSESGPCLCDLNNNGVGNAN